MVASSKSLALWRSKLPEAMLVRTPIQSHALRMPWKVPPLNTILWREEKFTNRNTVRHSTGWHRGWEESSDCVSLLDWMDLESMLKAFRHYPKPTPTFHSQKNGKWVVGLHLNSAGDLGESHLPNSWPYVAAMKAITGKITRDLDLPKF